MGWFMKPPWGEVYLGKGEGAPIQKWWGWLQYILRGKIFGLAPIMVPKTKMIIEPKNDRNLLLKMNNTNKKKILVPFKAFFFFSKFTSNHLRHFYMRIQALLLPPHPPPKVKMFPTYWLKKEKPNCLETILRIHFSLRALDDPGPSIFTLQLIVIQETGWGNFWIKPIFHFMLQDILQVTMYTQNRK